MAKIAQRAAKITPYVTNHEPRFPSTVGGSLSLLSASFCKDKDPKTHAFAAKGLMMAKLRTPSIRKLSRTFVSFSDMSSFNTCRMGRGTNFVGERLTTKQRPSFGCRGRLQ